MDKEIKIQTPYGVKNWSYLQRLMDADTKAVMMERETKRERVKDAIISLAMTKGMTREEVYADACEFADVVFEALGISAAEQDKP